MKKVFITFSLLATLLTIACDTSKNSVATVTAPPPPETPAKPQKGEMQATDMKPMQATQYEKKALPTKGKLQPMEAVIEADSVVPKH